MEAKTFKVYQRTKNEKINQLRKNKEIPCVIYGKSLEQSLLIKIDKSELIRMLNSKNVNSLITFRLNRKRLKCLIKEVQKDNNHDILHIDLLCLNKKKAVI